MADTKKTVKKQEEKNAKKTISHCGGAKIIRPASIMQKKKK